MSRGEIRIDGLREFRRGLAEFTKDPEGKKQLQKGNANVADLVIAKSQQLADGKIQVKAAATLKPAKRTDGVYVIGGSRDIPYFGGANFGAYNDVLRVLKASRMYKGQRGRATMVRKEEEWRVDKIVRKIEQQYVSASGKTITRREGREGGLRIQVARTGAGSVRTMRGWNQFKPWRKDQDYMLYRAIKNNIDEIVALYFKELDRLTKQAFPD